jgi:hypothetical protein
MEKPSARSGAGRIAVECYAGYRAEQTPRRFRLGGRVFEIAQVVDCWLGPDHRYFKVLADDEGIYILRHDLDEDAWELTLFSRSDALQKGEPLSKVRLTQEPQ